MSTDSTHEPIVRALSAERMAAYRLACEDDLEAAVRLYEWNIAVSGAFHELLAVAEVILRNAVHDRLTQLHGSRPGAWLDDPRKLLHPAARDDIGTARLRVRRLGRPETPGRIIAELPFGFWKFLLAKRYEAILWTPSLRHAFPNLRPQRRATAYAAVDSLHTLRNRIAHHEPIHHRDLHADLRALERMLDWIDRDVCAWAMHCSRVAATLPTRTGR